MEIFPEKNLDRITDPAEIELMFGNNYFGPEKFRETFGLDIATKENVFARDVLLRASCFDQFLIYIPSCDAANHPLNLNNFCQHYLLQIFYSFFI